MLAFKNQVALLLAQVLEMDKENIFKLLEIPPEPEMGEAAFPCFHLAKLMRKAPPLIASELASSLKDRLSKGCLVQKIEARGPYLNFFVDRKQLTRQLLRKIQEEKNNYGASTEGEGKTVVIDFSAPNIAKPFGIGHLRSTVIGNALYRIYRFQGYRVAGINHLGDWGTQFGKLIVAYKKWGEEEALEKDPIGYLYQLYVAFHQKAKTEPGLEDEARSWFKALEDGDEEALSLWRRFKDLSLEEFKRIYDYLGIHFDSYQGESFYNDRLGQTISFLQEKGLVKESQGALIVDLEAHGLPPCLLRKKDGATLYITRDLAAAIYRHESYSFEKMLYVVGAEQTLHFKQLFKVLELAGLDWSSKCYHIPFGLIRFPDGRMSTREGKTIFLEEVLNRAVKLAREIIEEKNPEHPNKDKAARAVGLGAVIFGDLSNDRIKDIDFDWDKILDFSGETAPYIQYAHARIHSILRKAGFKPGSLPCQDVSGLDSPPEEQLVISLSLLPQQLQRTLAENKPSILARYLIDVAKDFNKFYHNCPVLTAKPPELKEARLLLCDATRQVLATGLNLLGIEAPTEM